MTKPNKVEEIKSDIYEAMRHLPHIGETATVNKIYTVFEKALTSSYEQGVRDERIEQNEEIRKIVKQFQYLATDKWHKGAYEKIGNEVLNALKNN